ncbi:unnamed protein product [Prorocentrum cordatum]|uniref:Protein RFT1 homolog n=1 Tax=Prorocentrum cordatum TaxID=2364126 RepID=A0ABN9SJ88_9DINO|nr:unnamed protein product [Polarella glacialis]
MQPLGYLAARLLLSCFQAFERHERAFVGSEPLLLAAGVGHCWAVAYSLILSLAMQASRLAGGRDYMDKLPDWVFKDLTAACCPLHGPRGNQEGRQHGGHQNC